MPLALVLQRRTYIAEKPVINRHRADHVWMRQRQTNQVGWGMIDLWSVLSQTMLKTSKDNSRRWITEQQDAGMHPWPSDLTEFKKIFKHGTTEIIDDLYSKFGKLTTGYLSCRSVIKCYKQNRDDWHTADRHTAVELREWWAHTRAYDKKVCDRAWNANIWVVYLLILALHAPCHHQVKLLPRERILELYSWKRC